MPSRPALLRRRTVRVPTLWGWLLLLLLVLAVGLFFARWIGVYLARSEPALGAETLIVEGWLSARDLDAAVVAFRAGRYQQVIVSGGPFDDWPEDKRFASYAERAADYVRRHGLADASVTAAPTPPTARDRTFLSAVVVRDAAARAGSALGRVDVYTSGVHAHRTRLLYRMALGPAVEVGVLTAPPDDFDPARWWTTSAGAKAVLGEALAVAWTRCCFWPQQADAAAPRVPAPASSP